MVNSESMQIVNNMYLNVKMACEQGHDVRVGTYDIWKHEDGYSFCPAGENCSTVAYENLIDAIIEMLKEDFQKNEKPKGIKKLLCMLNTVKFKAIAALTGGQVRQISFDDILAGMEHKKKLMILQGEI